MPTHYKHHCSGCPYEDAAHLPAPFRQIRSSPLIMEDNNACVLLIFQAPGVDEWKNGRPVISKKQSSAGARLEAAFRIAHRTRQDFNITNTVQCFPGKSYKPNRRGARDNAPPAKVRQHCSEWLRQDIEAHTYERIVVFGVHAHKAVRGLGYGDDPRFQFVTHPTGGISNEELAKAVG